MLLTTNADRLEGLLLSATVEHNDSGPHFPADTTEESIAAPMPEEVAAAAIVANGAEVFVADVDLAGVDFMEGSIRVCPPRSAHLPIHHSKA